MIRVIEDGGYIRFSFDKGDESAIDRIRGLGEITDIGFKIDGVAVNVFSAGSPDVYTGISDIAVFVFGSTTRYDDYNFFIGRSYCKTNLLNAVKMAIFRLNFYLNIDERKEDWE